MDNKYDDVWPREKKMKSKRLLCVLILFCIFTFAACSHSEDIGNDKNFSLVFQEEDMIETSDDLIAFWTDLEELYTPTDESLAAINTQFYQGEIVRIWSQRKHSEENTILLDVYMYREDGSYDVLAQSMSTEYRSGWFLDAEGNYYVTSGNKITKLDKEGKEIYSSNVIGKIRDICQLNDGRIILLVREDSGDMSLVELNPETGETSKKENIALGENSKQFIGAGRDGLLLLNADGVWELNLQNGAKECVVSFEKYAYDLNAGIMDFRMSEEGHIELLEGAEKTTLKLVNISETREIVVLRDLYNDYGLEEAIARFNRENEKYYVVLETCPEDTEANDYINRTNIEIVSGSGPDIVTANMVESVDALIAKGVLENLAPYLEKNGIDENNYFPSAFDLWRDGERIYGICVNAQTQGLKIDAQILKNCEEITVESLLDVLIQYPEEAIFVEYKDSAWILGYFLSGSESLWGMIDRNARTCDFSGNLFAKMLEVSKRYGDSGKKEGNKLAEYVFAQDGFYTFETKAQLEKKGQIYIGYFFDDGCYAAQFSNRVLAVNSHSPYKEGIWEFFSFLLSDEMQSEWAASNAIPVNKVAFEKVAEKEIEEGSIVEYVKDGKPGKEIKYYSAYLELDKDEDAYRELYDLTPEKVDEITERLENTKVLPRQTEPIMTIIYEEAASYFSGIKSMEEVCDIIENRVQLYLDENM